MLPFLLVLCAGVVAWWGVWRGEFLFDDGPAIEENQALQAGDWWGAAFGETHQPLANRPLSCVSLVIDLALFGPGPFGPHLTNLLLHLGNALLLLATLRRVLLAPNLAGRFTASGATALATAVAAVWVVHPLAGDAVAYATQRSTLLFSGFFLLALHASVRADVARTAAGAGRWRLLVWVAVAGGMASKEEMVAAPLLLVLFERAFLVSSWSAMRARIGRYLALACTWVVLGACVTLGPGNSTVGFHTESRIGPHEWLMTQAGVVAQYLRLSLWPHPLRGAYDWDIVRTLGPCVLPGLVVVALLVGTAACWRRWPWWGWLGAMFFLLLAPTSTILPIDTEVVAERRAYLPMLFPIVTLLVAGRGWLQAGIGQATRWLGPAVVVAILVALTSVTRGRVAVYADGPTFWADAFANRDPASRSFLASQLLCSHATMLCRQGRFDEANLLFDEAMQCARPSAITRMYHATSLQQRGDSDAAIAALRQLVHEYPAEGSVFGELGSALMRTYQPGRWAEDDARLVEAESVLRRAVALRPGRASYWNSLGNVLSARGRLAEAEPAYRRSTELTTDHPEVYFRRAAVLEQLGRGDEAAPMFARLLAARPGDVALRLRLAEIDVGRRDFAAARALLAEVLTLDPQNARAIALQRQCAGGR
ncbi:MAG: tetratricopeptide repeat protein [Planctomycetes bacterium]|nr:tetratricopeptide repeat protein [Planctomycetota bacterium]